MISKIECINRLQHPENRKVLQAVEELRANGRLFDGSLMGAALCQAQLQGANLAGADLRYVDLHQADLASADLRNARLQAAKMSRASLQGADLENADLTMADLYKVNLREARNLGEAQLSAANDLFGCILPDGSVYDGRFNLFGDLARARWAKIDLDDPKAMADFYGVSLERYLQGQQKEALVLS
jgi:uncharacterized protein YjbI with pentapeptide repeats